jgi:hypothetical protein
MGNPGVLARGRWRGSCPAPLAWSAPAQPNEPERDAQPTRGAADLRTDWSLCGYARTDPSTAIRTNSVDGGMHERTRGCTFQRNPRATLSDRTQRVAAFPNEPNGCTIKRTRAWQNPNEPKPCAPERTRALRQFDEFDLQPSCTNEPERVEIQANPSRAPAKRTRARRHPNKPTWRRAHERVEAFSESGRTRASRPAARASAPR